MPERLSDRDPAVRRQVVAEVGHDPVWVPALIDRLAAETDPAVRSSLCSQLSRHDLPEVVDSMLGHLAGEDAALRSAAVGVLVRTTRSTLARLPALTDAADPDVRILGVMVLAGLDDPAARQAMLVLVHGDPHPNVVAAALSELVPRLTDEERPQVQAAVRRFADDPFLSFVAGSLLGPASGSAAARP